MFWEFSDEVRKLFETPCRMNCERNSKHVKRFMLGRVSLLGILCSVNTMTEEIREIFERRRRRNCETKSKHVKRFVRTG